MAELIDEDLRILHTPSFAVSNQNSFRSFAIKWLNGSENGLTEVTKNKYSRICEEYIFSCSGKYGLPQDYACSLRFGNRRNIRFSVENTSGYYAGYVADLWFCKGKRD